MRRFAAVLLALALLVAGCTGVPESSSPQVLRTVAVGGDQSAQPSSPAPGVLPVNLVQTFLAVNSAAAGKHASARSFLTPAARSRWTDTTVTVVSSLSVGAYTPGKPITVTATELGTVNDGGVYTPYLQVGKAATVQFAFGIGTVGGQYRINSLRSGLVLTEQQFEDSFVPRSVYFFDLAHRYLVPDARWTPDTDPIDASESLMNELAAGPTEGLQNAVSTDTLPAQAASRHIDVTGTDPVKIEIAGASQLDSTSKNRLAAQIAATLSDIDRGRSLQITDGGTPVPIPRAGGADFVASDSDADMVVPPVQEVYYLRGGQLVFSQTRKVVPGSLNDSRYPLTSAALSRSGPGGDLSLAGVTSVDGIPELVMGSQTTGLHRSTVTGVTSRPAFAPGRVEAWVGAGSAIYRCVLAGTRITATRVQLQFPAAVAGQQVKALRLSPEGSRIALILGNGPGHQKLYVGAVVRGAGTQVSIGTLQQISPNNVTVTDLAWIEGERLNAIGYDTDVQDAHVYRTGADGSAWNEYPIGGLPAPPTSLAGAPGAPAWASAGGNVYLQASGTVWSNPGGGRASAASGTAPSYVE